MQKDHQEAGESFRKLIFLTGRPGVGKTTVLMKVVEALKGMGYKVGGMVSFEVREGRDRVGFEIMDLSTGRRGVLAHMLQRDGPKISKYRVNLRDLRDVGAAAISNAVREADVVVIDEVTPMETFSQEFNQAVKEAMESGKLLLGTIHYKARGPIMELIRSNPNVEIFEVTYWNREEAVKNFLSKALKLLKR